MGEGIFFSCLDEESRFRNSAGRPENGTALAKSSSVHSGFSWSINSGFGLFISISLLSVSPSQTDDPESAAAHGEYQRIKLVSNEPKSPGADFAVILAHVHGVNGRSKIEIRHHVKTKPTLLKIALILPWVERNLHA